MDGDRFEAQNRAREYFHDLRLLPGAWPIVRVDGRSFSRFTEERFDKPFDARFSQMMRTVASGLVEQLGGMLAYTESDEISVLLPRDWDLFGRKLEKVVSVSAGIASSVFSLAAGEPAHFDSRVWLGTSIDDVVGYFSWRQADAARCALNGWCYWTLRKNGCSAREATRRLERATASTKNELLFEHGINFNDVPAWQRRGLLLRWEEVDHVGHNPITGESVPTVRRRLTTAADLPMGEGFRETIASLLA
jgi:tRNA(His) guanylyltransferase